MPTRSTSSSREMTMISSLDTFQQTLKGYHFELQTTSQTLKNDAGVSSMAMIPFLENCCMWHVSQECLEHLVQDLLLALSITKTQRRRLLHRLHLKKTSVFQMLPWYILYFFLKCCKEFMSTMEQSWKFMCQKGNSTHCHFLLLITDFFSKFMQDDDMINGLWWSIYVNQTLNLYFDYCNLTALRNILLQVTTNIRGIGKVTFYPPKPTCEIPPGMLWLLVVIYYYYWLEYFSPFLYSLCYNIKLTLTPLLINVASSSTIDSID